MLQTEKILYTNYNTKKSSSGPGLRSPNFRVLRLCSTTVCVGRTEDETFKARAHLRQLTDAKDPRPRGVASTEYCWAHSVKLVVEAPARLTFCCSTGDSSAISQAVVLLWKSTGPKHASTVVNRRVAAAAVSAPLLPRPPPSF